MKVRRRGLVAAAAVAGTVVAVAVIVPSVDTDALRRSARTAAGDPGAVVAVLAAFAAAFALRAVLWCRVLPGLGFGQALAAIHVALGANHVLPLRLGEGMRVVSVVRRAGVSLPAATASTVTLRTADLLTCAGVAVVGSPAVAVRVFGPWGWLAVAGLAVAGAAGVGWTLRLRGVVRVPGPLVVGGAALAWCLEALVVLATARWAGIDAGYQDALVVVGTSVAAQLGAVTPAGFGTYEAAAVAAWSALGFDPATGLAAALGAHALKTAYSLLAGAAGALWPAPGLFGRLRLARRPPLAPAPAADGPVVLFLPARNEAPRVAAVLRRVPAAVAGRPVHVLVVDDGSSDGTGAVAAAEGASVIRVDPGRGLGAAVRRGLAEGVARGAAAVAFCDADGEYDPAELDRLVAPILDGRADYVVGSRFAGDIRRMLPHRRLGNRVLTAALSVVARRPIGDGQSGYRALSARAAAAADVVHDFNYAQVLTLDLLGKGFAYAEVPITYGFRESGRSFVRLGRYLRAVVPAVYRELTAA